jgi:putative transposase
MSRLRRLVLADRYFFVACNLLRTRAVLNEDDFEILARVMQARRAEHGFLLTAWVFLPDHWHAILGPRYLKGLSRVMESVKVSSTRQINAGRGELGRLWQGRFFDRALRTVKEYQETVEYIHLNPLRRGLVKRPEDWKWSSVHEYAFPPRPEARHQPPLRIDRVRPACAGRIPAEERARI